MEEEVQKIYDELLNSEIMMNVRLHKDRVNLQRIAYSLYLAEKQGWECNNCRQPIYVGFTYLNKGVKFGPHDNAIKANLHHKNHDHNDNRPGNIEVLCLSCHSLIHRCQNNPQLSFASSTLGKNKISLQYSNTGGIR